MSTKETVEEIMRNLVSEIVATKLKQTKQFKQTKQILMTQSKEQLAASVLALTEIIFNQRGDSKREDV